MHLRDWQREAINMALIRYQKPHSHFLCLATPGAGKTIMASSLSERLLTSGKVDLVICFSPSAVVANDFCTTLEEVTKESFSGGLGSKGKSLTYQSMAFLGEEFWFLLDKYRVFVIFDEIHHCAGQQVKHANSWGAHIIERIQNRAQYTLALTGTPWRSDPIPISLSRYCSNNSVLQVDYKYDLQQAITDNVCRSPNICVIDSDSITVTEDKEISRFSSFSDLIENSQCSYSNLIENKQVISEILSKGINRLNKERREYSDAGGLIVAKSTAHAMSIKTVLRELGETSVLVSYLDKSAPETIANFKYSNQKWIISIGMISEGTNIPRLRVCCYLSLVTTELYFRQVLGRILRTQSAQKEVGYMFMPSHPLLTNYAQSVAENVPHFAVFEMEQNTTSNIKIDAEAFSRVEEKSEQESDMVVNVGEPRICDSEQNNLETWYQSAIGSFGRFHQKIFKL